MSEEYAERLSVTLKGGKDFSDPWIVFKGGTIEDLTGELKKLEGDPELMRATAFIAAAFQAHVLAAKSGATPQFQAAVVPTQQPAASPQPATNSEPTPQASQPAAGGFCASCGTGLDYKAFTSKAGKDIKGYFCPNGKQRGDGHTSKFI